MIDGTEGRITIVKGTNDLVIQLSREEDSGIYQCVAKNGGGEIQASALIIIVATSGELIVFYVTQSRGMSQ